MVSIVIFLLVYSTQHLKETCFNFFQFKMTLLKCDIVTLALFIFHSEMRAPLVSGEKKDPSNLTHCGRCNASFYKKERKSCSLRIQFDKKDL